MSLNLKNLLIITILFIVFWSCRETGQSGEVLDTPTSGNIVVAADESFQPLLDTSKEVFETIYKYAKINIKYQAEDEAIQNLLNDSVRLVIVTRELEAKEKEVFKKQEIRPTVVKLGSDAVALITHRQNADSLLTMDQLAKIFSGKIKTWKELNPKNQLNKEIILVFDNSNSSNLNYIQRKFKLENTKSLKIFAVNKNEEVIDYVEKNEGAVGIIGVNWISDSDDSKRQRFLDRISVVAVADTINPSPDQFYQPYQYYLYLGKYPLIREIFAISREARSGLGTGFITFMRSDRGQRIILKEDLLPVVKPGREVQITNKSLE
jgi:phosphate transport system substrate-binding protein